MNLGRSASTPGAYHIWVPSERKTVLTSEAYFSETSFPWRSDGSTPAPVLAQPSERDAEQPAGLPRTAPSHSSRPPSNESTREKPASQSRRALLLFSGPISRTDGIAAFISRMGLETDCVDSDSEHGGGESHNVLRDSVYKPLLERCAAGHYVAVIASPPCSTFSVSRFFSSP
eukprot:5090530-Pleurochrysis_carterae.AAC.1